MFGYNPHYPEDRSFRPDAATIEDYIANADDIILRAHFVAPVWTDTAVVSTRPDPAEIGSYIAINTQVELFPILSDDCLILTRNGTINQLVTIAPIHFGSTTAYQLTINQFNIDVTTIGTLMLIRDLARTYTLIDYPDAQAIDEHKFTGAGIGFNQYSTDPRRQRPIFVMRRFSAFSGSVRNEMSLAKLSLTMFGPVVVSDKIHSQISVRHDLEAHRTETIAIPPAGEPYVIDTAAPDFMPDEIRFLADDLPLLKLDNSPDDARPIGPNATSLWSQNTPPTISLATLVEQGARFRQVMDDFSKSHTIESQSEVPQTYIPPRLPPAETVELVQDRQIELDGEGLPIRAEDIPIWASRTLANRLIILGRAAKALAKSDHPEPTRIAKGLQALAEFKPRIAAGDRHAIDEFNNCLMQLRLRDGFSNAEYLKGQTGDAYLFTHDGRKMLLDRHLASTVSGFNDPKLIRIYYTRDKHTGTIIVGSAPYHLPTKKS